MLCYNHLQGHIYGVVHSRATPKATFVSLNACGGYQCGWIVLLVTATLNANWVIHEPYFSGRQTRHVARRHAFAFRHLTLETYGVDLTAGCGPKVAPKQPCALQSVFVCMTTIAGMGLAAEDN